jgi:hypothetical protein
MQDPAKFEWLIWVGTVIALIGVGALIWCIFYAIKVRRGGLDDATLRAGLQKAVVINMAALFASTIGLMLVVAGIFLG